MRPRKVGSIRAAAVAALMAVSAGAVAPRANAEAINGDDGQVHGGEIGTVLQQTMDRLGFQQVLDLAPIDSAQFNALNTGTDKDAVSPTQRASRYAAANSVAQPISQQPQIDASVLELDAAGRIMSSGTVLMSPQYPHGVVVPVDREFRTTAVRYREWDDTGWYTNHAQGTVDVVPGRENAPLDFMLPYPASVLKLMVSFGVLRLVDAGAISLDDTYDYQPTAASALCGGASSNTVRGYVDASLTWSSNAASCALIKLLWDHNAIDGLNQQFQDLGLETLRLIGTNPANGGRWTNSVTMSSLDTAKLLALVNGGRGTLWNTPGGTAVTRAVLSDSSRNLFLSLLGQQGWNWMLSTTNYCGRGYPAPGIPQVTASRWISADGTVDVEGNLFGQDVRPCNRAAQVRFAHKPGWVSNSAADVGIVHSLPGAPGRHYIIAVFSNLGDQYRDPNRAETPAGTVPVGFTEKFAQLGRAIDQYEARRK